jgi:hypothetical protein
MAYIIPAEISSRRRYGRAVYGGEDVFGRLFEQTRFFPAIKGLRASQPPAGLQRPVDLYGSTEREGDGINASSTIPIHSDGALMMGAETALKPATGVRP